MPNKCRSVKEFGLKGIQTEESVDSKGVKADGVEAGRALSSLLCFSVSILSPSLGAGIHGWFSFSEFAELSGLIFASSSFSSVCRPLVSLLFFLKEGNPKWFNRHLINVTPNTNRNGLY